MEGLSEPVDAVTGRLLRRAVLDHAALEHRRRSFAPVLHAGRPGADPARLPLTSAAALDPGLATDVVAALRLRARAQCGGEPLLWLTRPGGLELQDDDARWLAAARAAYVEAGALLTFVVVNRHGWRDPRTGLGRTWQRLRRTADST